MLCFFLLYIIITLKIYIVYRMMGLSVIIMGYRKYNWIGNKISDDDMGKLYRIKKKTKRPITKLVAEAVREYVANVEE